MTRRRPARSWVHCAALLALLSAFAAAAEETRLDDGLLDPAWFGPAVTFKKTDVIDYVWVKPGFSLKGKSLRVEGWPDPVFLREDRKARDAAMAFQLAEKMPRHIRTVLMHELQGVAQVVPEGGDLLLSGRLVDYVGKGTMRASSPQATWDMKITDAKSGELLAAVHHRRLMSISTVEERIVMWLEEFGRALHDDLKIATP
jgi:hypothetical protein